MEAIERDHLQVADIMLFRRIADAQLQLSTTSEIGRNYLSQAKEKGVYFWICRRKA